MRAGAELAWLPGCAAGWPAAALARCRLSCSLPLPPRGSASKLASAGGSGDSSELFPRGWLLRHGSDCPWPSENAPRSLQGLHFVACGLAASPLGHVVIWGTGGGARKRERELASRTALLPARTVRPQPGREREPRNGPTTKAARLLQQPTTAPRTMPAWPGARGFWRPEGFQTQEAFGAVDGHA